MLNIIGLSSGLIGSVILAFSLSSIISMLSLVVSSKELEAVSNGEARVTGLDVHMSKSKSVNKFWTLVGLLFLIAGFALQLLSLFLK